MEVSWTPVKTTFDTVSPVRLSLPWWLSRSILLLFLSFPSKCTLPLDLTSQDSRDEKSLTPTTVLTNLTLFFRSLSFRYQFYRPSKLREPLDRGERRLLHSLWTLEKSRPPSFVRNSQLHYVPESLPFSKGWIDWHFFTLVDKKWYLYL